ncbi:MAG: hypothetical protein P8P46_11295, partial [Alphaproteobacteria bacterium]|nr:hypothetical protein [Alphaproteobacteria bacterium]
MSQDPEYFYLQIKRGETWDTLCEAELVTDLTETLSARGHGSVDEEVRIVGAIFDDEKNEWLYEQLFFAASKSEVAQMSQISSSDLIEATSDKINSSEPNLDTYINAGNISDEAGLNSKVSKY